MSKGEVDISAIIGIPILTELTNGNYMWTGMIRPSSVDELLIPNEEMRRDFKNMIIQYEKNIVSYRELLKSEKSVLTVKSSSDKKNDMEKRMLTEQIQAISQQINILISKMVASRDLESRVFYIRLFKEYERVLKNNPQEFRNLDPQLKYKFQQFKEGMSREPILLKTSFDKKENKFRIVPILAECQKGKLPYNENNWNELSKVLEIIEGKKDLSEQRKIELLQELTASMPVVDIDVIFSNKQYARMQYSNFFRNYLLKKGYPPKTVFDMNPKVLEEQAFDLYHNESLEEHATLMIECIMDSIGYLDIEKFLLLASIRSLESFETMTFKKESESDELGIDLEQDEEFLYRSKRAIVQETDMNSLFERNRRKNEIITRMLNANIISSRTKARIVMSSEEKEVSLKTLRTMMENYCDGVYITETTIAHLVWQAVNTEVGLSDWSNELIEIMDFDFNEKSVIGLSNLKNIKRLFETGKLDKDEITSLLIETRNLGDLESKLQFIFENSPSRVPLLLENAKGVFKYLYDEKIINIEDLKAYFEEGIISIDDFDELEDVNNPEQNKAVRKELKGIVTSEELLQKYKECVERYIYFINLPTNDPVELENARAELNRARKEKNKYLLMFQKYNTFECEQEKIDFGNQLIEQYYIYMQVEDPILGESIKLMYEDGLIELENIITIDKNYIFPMLDKLSLDDASKIRKSMSFKEVEAMIDNIFASSDFTDESKFIVMLSLLNEDTAEDERALKKFRKLLGFDEVHHKKKSGPDDDDHEKGGEKGKPSHESRKFRYSDAVKWRFFKILDKDARPTKYLNGYVEFASSKFGARIIEKYYDKAGKESYGTATIVIPEKRYRENQEKLVTITPKGNKLEIAELRKLVSKKERITHRTQSKTKTWMDEIIRYLGIGLEKDSRYTDEEIRKLRDTIQKNKEKYTEIR